MLNHERKSHLVGILASCGAKKLRVQPGIGVALGQRVANQPRDNEQVNRKELQERREDAAPAGRLLVWGSERPLHDVLIRAPVPEADDRRAYRHAEPGKTTVKVPGLFYKLPGFVRHHD